jgi:hypothetical protein
VGDDVVKVTVPWVSSSAGVTGVMRAALELTTMIFLEVSSAFVLVFSAADIFVLDELSVVSKDASLSGDKQAGVLWERSAVVPIVGVFGKVDRALGVVSAVLDGDGPNPMSGLVPVSPESSKSKGSTSIALADGSGARESLVRLLGHWVFPIISALDVPLGVVLGVESIVLEFEVVSSDDWVALLVDTFKDTLEFSHGAGVAKPELLARSVNEIDWSPGSGYEPVCSFGEAPASIKTVPGDTLVDWLKP